MSSKTWVIFKNYFRIKIVNLFTEFVIAVLSVYWVKENRRCIISQYLSSVKIFKHEYITLSE